MLFVLLSYLNVQVVHRQRVIFAADFALGLLLVQLLHVLLQVAVQQRRLVDGVAVVLDRPGAGQDRRLIFAVRCGQVIHNFLVLRGCLCQLLGVLVEVLQRTAHQRGAARLQCQRFLQLQDRILRLVYLWHQLVYRRVVLVG